MFTSSYLYTMKFLMFVKSSLKSYRAYFYKCTQTVTFEQRISRLPPAKKLISCLKHF